MSDAESKRKSDNVEAVKRYQQGRDAIMLRPSKADGAQIRQAAADAGQSVTAYIMDAVRARMEQDK